MNSGTDTVRQFVLRIHMGLPLREIPTTSDPWRRLWWWTEHIDTTTERLIAEAWSCPCELPAHGRASKSLPKISQDKRSVYTLNFDYVFGMLVQFDELEIVESEYERDVFLKCLEHLAMHLGMPVRFADSKRGPVADLALMELIQELEENRLSLSSRVL